MEGRREGREGWAALGVLSSGNCSLEREIDKRKKADMQTEFQKQKNETQPSHVFAASLGLVRDCMKSFFSFHFTQEGCTDVPVSRLAVSLFSFS